ncbi:MAG TPA: DUF2179 domain-containing protein [Clostridium sp.]|uniref:UPF0316 protein EFD62_10120 n=1 Tax=Acetivibrio mesophilus TaxID=2487273 RepID=A0A4Q0I7A4_9FIRM|nr:DUF2179 domain-containing protein [Acetivibrio mesophilus]RXE58882.1 DUF2179 domain-containing protein [Acetivibrio mesophilus]HHV28956.1 DUF2179 domain-containing protein [Clostridium sp.]
MAKLISPELFSWFVLPLLIFCSRIIDVTIGTIRIIFVSRGKKHLAPILGFFEVLVWIVAISQVMQNLSNFVCYFAYAAGFATGTYVGIIIEEKLAIGTLVVRTIVDKNEFELKEQLANSGFGVTVVDAEGKNGDVKIIYTVIKRKELQEVIRIIEGCNSKAFYSIEDARKVSQGIFRSGTSSGDRTSIFNLFRIHRMSGLNKKMK